MQTPAGQQIETHPLAPFLPRGARLLMLGTFPPPRARWSMEFYYPNFQNDMWRIFGIVFFGDRDHFVADPKHFDRDRLEVFLRERGIAVSDTAAKVRRLRGNASDQFLEIVETIDLASILGEIPDCGVIMTAGEKATSALTSVTGSPLPPLGGFVEFEFPVDEGQGGDGGQGIDGGQGGDGDRNADGSRVINGSRSAGGTGGIVRNIRHYRMPSSSRAYPRPLLEKAEVYGAMFRELGFIDSDS